MPSRPFNLGRKRVGSWLAERAASRKRLLFWQPVAPGPGGRNEGVGVGQGGERMGVE